MRFRPLGSSGIQASAVGFGAWAIGGWMWGGADDDLSIKALQSAIDGGMNLIDTAPIYGYGKSEQLVGKAIAGRRDRVVLATKCGLRWNLDQPAGKFHFAADDKAITPDGSGQTKVHRWLNPESIRYEVEQSLTRLNTDYIDLYQTHWMDPTTPVPDAMGALLDLKRQGKIRAIGLSNAAVDDLAAYCNVGPLDSTQEKYSMLDRKLEADLLPYCHEHNIAVLAYSPLANGLLTGRIGPDRKFNEGDLRGTRPRFSVENRQKVATLLASIQPVADARDLTLAQLVIAWTIAQPGLTHALCGARSPQQVAENGAAAEVTLSDDELATIAAAIDEHCAAGSVV